MCNLNNRDCKNFFGEAVNKYDISICQSDNQFKECIFYKMVNQPKDEQCKFMEICSHVALKPVLSLPFTDVIRLAEMFCLNPANQKNCAIYKKIDHLKRVPENLLPDGTTIKFNE